MKKIIASVALAGALLFGTVGINKNKLPYFCLVIHR
jgi:hypothetical protein